ncbi:aspartate/glutamate racemase family protein [Isoptericola sp. NPDC056573]|uniref:aspartate/glutamate racemase family protein n=1 Tax=Isoptericola sp. NPDC056573 TaxID=3345868 RepID=UPI0036CAFD08
MPTSTTRPRDRRPLVALVNPNTNRRTTTMMADLARAELAAVGADVVEVTAAHGPAMIVEPDALVAAEAAVLDVVREVVARDRPDAVVVAAIGDPGRAALAAELDVPVVGIGQASVLAAAAGGRRFGMVTTTDRLAGALGDLVAAHGCSAGFTGVELTRDGPLELAADPEEQYRQLLDAVRAAERRGAEAVIVAGGPLSETARRLRETVAVTIVEPVPAACGLLRGLDAVL